MVLPDKIRQQMTSKGKRTIDGRAQQGGCLSMAEKMVVFWSVTVLEQVDPSEREAYAPMSYLDSCASHAGGMCFNKSDSVTVGGCRPSKMVSTVAGESRLKRITRVM